MARRPSSRDAIDRMLARERGEAVPAEPQWTPEQGQKTADAQGETEPTADRRSDPSAAASASTVPAKGRWAGFRLPVKQLSPAQLRRRHRRRVFFAVVLLLALALAALVSGAVSSSLVALGDVADSVTLYLNRSGGYPSNTGIVKPRQIEPLAGGFVELGSEDVVVYSAYGTKVRSFQPNYSRPALAAGNTRFCVYNRGGTELRVESRTQKLYSKVFENSILLCAVSNNGSVAVATESNRYASQVEVYDALFQPKYIWATTKEVGTVMALRFAADNRRFAAGCVGAKNGQLCTKICFVDLEVDGWAGVHYEADPGSMVLELNWLSPNRLLAVFDDYAAILDPVDGHEAVRYDYNGAAIESMSLSGRDTALLLSSRGGSTMVILDDSLKLLASVPLGEASSLACTRTSVFVVSNGLVRSFALDGTLQWSKTFSTTPVAVLYASRPLVFTESMVSVLEKPADAA